MNFTKSLIPGGIARCAGLLAIIISPVSVGAQQPSTAIQISSPSSGALVSPGQILSVSVAATPASVFTAVGVVGQDVGYSAAETSPPFTFTLNIPNDVVGMRALTAVGLTASGDAFFSPPVIIDMEPSNPPTSLMVSSPAIRFETIGGHIPFRVVGTFADGSSLDVTQSSNMSYVSSDTTVAAVETAGIVRSVGGGTTSILVQYGPASQNLHATVAVTVAPPTITVSPTTLAFNNQAVGTTSVSQALTVTNSSPSALSVLNVAASGDFGETDNCLASSPIAAGANCTINVSFAPQTNGARQGTVSIANNLNGSPIVVNFTGSGIAPDVSLSTGGLAFDSQLVGTASSPQTITITNSGTAGLAISAVAPSGDFSESDDCTSSSPIVPGAVCTIAVNFSPSTAGARSGSLAVTDNVTGSPQMIALVGAGTDFSFGAASGGSTSATVSAGQPATYNLQLNPLGGFTGSVTLACTGAPTQATCASSAATVTASGTSPVAFQVNVTTTARSLALPVTNLRPRPHAPQFLLPFSVLCLVFVLAVALKFAASGGLQFVRAWAPAATMLLCLAALLTSSGCGGGNSSGPPPPPPAGGTPAGTYTLTVTGTSQGQNRTVALTLTVN